MRTSELWAIGVLGRAGMLPLRDPRNLPYAVRATRRWGPLGAPLAVSARRYGDRVAVVDELGELSFAELDERANRLCNAWQELGLKPGDGVALLTRNHRGFLEAAFATLKAGGRLILMNTDFAGPQARDVAAREGTKLLVYDEEFTDALDELAPDLGRFRAWTDSPGYDTLEYLIERGDRREPSKPEQEGKLVVLTSGTTGLPKGAPRGGQKTLVPTAGFLDRIPFRAGETTVIATPLFHALGLAHGTLAITLGTKMILRRRFDEAAIVQLTSRHAASALVLVPIMLRRILDLEDLDPGQLSSLRIIFLGGSQLGGELATRALNTFGPVVYNLYGSTEVSGVTIATPADLRAAPASVGTPPRGIRMRLYDDRDLVIGQPHVRGRIFAGTGMEFEGYSGGGNKTVIDGLMATGDVGHVDAAGRLFIDGRDDDMIVSGGENVFPGEIEELLCGHPDVTEAAVIGVPDDEFGARLRAFVVTRDGAELDEDAVRGYVRQNLARYKVPRDVVFVDQLPRNPTGKVLKRVLATG